MAKIGGGGGTQGAGRRKVRSGMKGRSVAPGALAQVRELLGDSPRRRDLLIEFGSLT